MIIETYTHFDGLIKLSVPSIVVRNDDHTFISSIPLYAYAYRTVKDHKNSTAYMPIYKNIPAPLGFIQLQHGGLGGQLPD
jgi:hypothetical protein